MKKSKGHRYDDAFKRSAVDHWIHGGKSGRQVAEDLGISEHSLQRWKEKYLSVDGPQLQSLEAEVERLRRENLEFRQERDILKKSVAIFLKPQR